MKTGVLAIAVLVLFLRQEGGGEGGTEEGNTEKERAGPLKFVHPSRSEWSSPARM
jgi:hypothetical protein